MTVEPLATVGIAPTRSADWSRVCQPAVATQRDRHPNGLLKPKIDAARYRMGQDGGFCRATELAQRRHHRSKFLRNQVTLVRPGAALPGRPEPPEARVVWGTAGRGLPPADTARLAARVRRWRPGAAPSARRARRADPALCRSCLGRGSAPGRGRTSARPGLRRVPRGPGRTL